jgi:CheY-like chemotaxis protein
MKRKDTHPMPSAVVLYVEDEETDSILMRMAFERAGLGDTLKVVADGRQAIAYLAGEGVYKDRIRYPMPAVIVLDLNLPIIPGFGVLDWIREQAALQSVPVIIFSSSNLDEDKTKARVRGADDYMEKPATGLEFRALVLRLKDRWLNGGGRSTR